MLLVKRLTRDFGIEKVHQSMKRTTIQPRPFRHYFRMSWKLNAIFVILLGCTSVDRSSFLYEALSRFIKNLLRSTLLNVLSSKTTNVYNRF
jgi:hypothetical protein